MNDTKKKLIASFSPEEPIVAMTVWGGRVIVATSRRLFEIIGDELVPLKLVVPEGEM